METAISFPSRQDRVSGDQTMTIKEAAAKATKSRRRSKRGASIQVLGKRWCDQEKEKAKHEIRASEVAQYCSVFNF